MDKLVLIDGNSIMNRAFYGIMGSKMLQTEDGTYTNAVYGFLNIMFKIIEDVKPKFLVVAFDLKAPTKRHLMYKEYKGTRKPMPNELAQQMPIIKEILTKMNIKIIEKEGYEADDILGTLSKFGEKNNLEVVLLTGDRDSFQLATKKTTIRIPRTKQGKTETEDFDEEKIIETYGIKPQALIEVKGLMGDASDNIPGVPGIGEKTALNLIKENESIENIYEKLESNSIELKPKLKENLQNNKELAFLSKTLGTIDTNAEIEKNLDDFKVEEWNKKEVLELFKKYRFKRFIDRFNLESEDEKTTIQQNEIICKEISSEEDMEKLINEIKETKIVFYNFEVKDCDNNDLIIKEKIRNVSIYSEKEETAYKVDFDDFKEKIKKIFENEEILKCGYDVKKDIILLKQEQINGKNILFDVAIAAYLLNSNSNNYLIKILANQYLGIDIEQYLNQEEDKNSQTSLFDTIDNEKQSNESQVNCFVISKLYYKLLEELKKNDMLDLFYNIEMPTAKVLADMQYTGVYVDEKEIKTFGDKLKKDLEKLKNEIYDLADEEFNINSTKQLGEILFEKLKLPVYKKTKSGYSTDVEVLEKLKEEHPIIEKILDYRQIMKLNSTYVEGLIPYINPKTKRIHTFFHQTVAATGRISSTEPNLQNIPTRTELGKNLRKVFKAEEGKVFIDADYSQIELRILAHMSNDEIMVQAFNNGDDIHAICASKIFNVPLEEVTKELRSRAKAVNFGIVYGISDFGLAEQTGIKRKEAKQYIEQYLEKYHGIKEYMNNIIEDTKKKGFVETIFKRRRYIPELKSSNYMVRKFGERAAMNTPIQGTAADIMKMAMIETDKKLIENNLKAKIVLQIHDELLVEAPEEEKDIVKNILKESMEKIYKLRIKLNVEVEEGKSWYDTK
ncbi:MAG: DNA polymerase I [Candidatus Scatovivens sp.]